MTDAPASARRAGAFRSVPACWLFLARESFTMFGTWGWHRA